MLIRYIYNTINIIVQHTSDFINSQNKGLKILKTIIKNKLEFTIHNINKLTKKYVFDILTISKILFTQKYSHNS